MTTVSKQLGMMRNDDILLILFCVREINYGGGWWALVDRKEYIVKCYIYLT